MDLSVMTKRVLPVLMALGCLLSPAVQAQGDYLYGEEVEGKPPSGAVVVLRGVDKITARITDIEAPLDEVAQFGSLQITMRYCHKNPPEETPEVSAFLEIEDHLPDQAPEKAFSGWMFASSPALSAMEHPVYDVWVMDCKASTPLIGAGKAPNRP
jgi:hypothetical protein